MKVFSESSVTVPLDKFFGFYYYKVSDDLFIVKVSYEHTNVAFSYFKSYLERFLVAPIKSEFSNSVFDIDVTIDKEDGLDLTIQGEGDRIPQAVVRDVLKYLRTCISDNISAANFWALPSEGIENFVPFNNSERPEYYPNGRNFNVDLAVEALLDNQLSYVDDSEPEVSVPDVTDTPIEGEGLSQGNPSYDGIYSNEYLVLVKKHMSYMEKEKEAKKLKVDKKINASEDLEVADKRESNKKEVIQSVRTDNEGRPDTNINLKQYIDELLNIK